MLRKSTFNKFMVGLKKLQVQHDADRKNKPDLAPMSWGQSIRSLVEHVCREDHHPFNRRTTPDEVIKYLLEKKIIMPYVGDYTFFQTAPLPTEAEIKKQVLTAIAALD